MAAGTFDGLLEPLRDAPEPRIDRRRRAHALLRGKTYAVRSSAPVEDAGWDSRAGQFLPQLDVSPDRLAAAVGGAVTPCRVAWIWNQVLAEANPDSPPLEAVRAFGKRAESFFGHPQDVEWCSRGRDVYFLQPRLIFDVNFRSAGAFAALAKALAGTGLAIADVLSRGGEGGEERRWDSLTPPGNLIGNTLEISDVSPFVSQAPERRRDGSPGAAETLLRSPRARKALRNARRL